MSGGSDKVFKGAMNSKFTSNIIPETVAKLEPLWISISNKKDEIPKLEFELLKFFNKNQQTNYFETIETNK